MLARWNFYIYIHFLLYDLIAHLSIQIPTKNYKIHKFHESLIIVTINPCQS